MGQRNSSMLAIVSSHGIMHAYLIVLPALLPLVKADLGDIQTVSFLASLVFLFYGWGSLPVGYLTDRRSKKMLIVASMGLCGTSSILVGLSQSLTMAAFSLILLGVGASLYHPPGYASLSLLSLELRGRYMGIQGSGGEIGMALAYITSPVLGVYFGWRTTFILWGLLGLITAIIDFLAATEIGDGEQSSNKDEVSDGGAKRQAASKETFSAERLRLLAITFAVTICSGALWNGVSSFILIYINEVKGLQLFLAGGLSMISYTVGALAQAVGGELSDKHSRRAILLMGFLPFAMALVLITLIPSSILLMLFAVSVLGFTFYLTQSPLNALFGDLSPKKTVGFTYGLNFTLKYGIGGVSPALAGFIAKSYSMDYAFYFFALIAGVAFSLSLMMRDVKNLR